MRIAVLGVGLIGGSIGLAARGRLEAEVVGYDPDRSTADRACFCCAMPSRYSSREDCTKRSADSTCVRSSCSTRFASFSASSVLSAR